MQTYTVTHKGNVRKENEDSLYISGDTLPIVAAVADGMGGHNAGKMASATTVDFIATHFSQSGFNDITLVDLKKFAEDISDKIFLISTSEPQYDSMGTTLSLIRLDNAGVKCAHIGDSRVYIRNEAGIKMLTVDHSYVQMLLDMGVLDEEDVKSHPYKNVITRAVGMQEVQADVFSADISEGDSLLVCSDGLIRHVTDEEISAIMCDMDCKEACEQLLSLALERGGSDNISIVMIKTESGDLK